MATAKQRDLVTSSGLFFEAASYTQRRIAEDVHNLTGLAGPWMEVLLRLGRTPGNSCRISELAGLVSFPPSSFSRLADRMEDEGLVRREPDPKNRRATLLHLTDAGRARLSAAQRAHDPSLRARFADLLTDDELDLLEKVTRTLRDANDPRR